MKTTVSLLLILSAGPVHAQTRDYRPASSDFGPHPEYGPRVGGEYESFAYGGQVHRTLRLDRNGRAEMVTERIAKGRGGSRDWFWEGDGGDRFGALAGLANRRAVRQTGRWSERDGRLRLRLDTTNADLRDAYAPELRGELRGGEIVLRGDRDLYGRDEMRFGLTDPRRDDRPGSWHDRDDRPRYGLLRMDRDEFRPIDTLDYEDVLGRARLKLRAGSRDLTFHGRTERRGDEVTFRINEDHGDRGRLTLLMDGGRIVGIRGRGDDDGRPFEIGL